MNLTVKYDPEADVLVFEVRKGALANEELLDNDVVLGYDNEGKMASVEILAETGYTWDVHMDLAGALDRMLASWLSL